MSTYDEPMESDKASEALTAELATATQSKYGRFKASVSNAVYRCTGGRAGTSSKACPYTK